MKFLIPYSLLVVLTSACATRHESMSGSVALKINENSGVACLPSGTAQVGKEITLYNTICERKGGDERGFTKCSKELIGNGKITKLVNDHYSEFTTNSGVKFEEGSLVE